jgi:hypothetical protein
MEELSKINFHQGKKFSIIKERISELFNMKNIHFLFGSGTSVSAIPTMEGLFDATNNEITALGEDNILLKQEFEKLKERAKDKNLEDILGFL